MPLGVPELAIILVILLVIFGPKRLPQLGRQLGSGMREFKDSVTAKVGDDDDDDKVLTQATAAPTATPTPAPATPVTATPPSSVKATDDEPSARPPA